MNSKENILKIAKDSFTNQGNAILNLHKFLTSDFENAVKKIQSSSGRVIVSGIGKSAIIGSKIVATFNSTGTPSIFMHAAEAIHGDLGIIQSDDIIILISKSGNTPEIKNLVPFIKQRNVNIISITSEPNSYLAKNSDYFLNSHIEKEACINNLAPTTSTTTQLVIGDALAICLSKINGFNENDFAKYHPGGMLGKKLYLKVDEIINKNLKPQLLEFDDFKTIIDVITKNLLGAAVVVKNNKPIGIITDGDIRRVFSNQSNFNDIIAKNLMSNNPFIIDSQTLASTALTIMNKNKISQVVVTENGDYLGLIHLHNILKEGLF
ncbi:MAG: KpsF/GutQ family sugar-phosphate isomerase [Flavobacteriaceae bacterium]|nr:KpsF/GutQ family sugar-phosphate isomerase [Flavobacteriaceae bacterium]MDG1343507.1 KpsF/GutQ family sugar-phosphate isomerase [Flavobacteriaceae bacterium]MDG1791917.1 KpsF/GutQ family sugar-phosphate isomerase [Flavobacteriaceae bacterium]MDG2485239.1 KpsF/GutQ family sugar-phosphate isomerase [Flavobacteriaceae bacterium]